MECHKQFHLSWQRGPGSVNACPCQKHCSLNPLALEHLALPYRSSALTCQTLQNEEKRKPMDKKTSCWLSPQEHELRLLEYLVGAYPTRGTQNARKLPELCPKAVKLVLAKSGVVMRRAEFWGVICRASRPGLCLRGKAHTQSTGNS